MENESCEGCKYFGDMRGPTCIACCYRPGKHPTNFCESVQEEKADRASHDASKEDKLPLQHLPAEALEECAKVMRWATVKYPYGNWRKGAPYMEFVGSILRHVWAFMRGKDKDEESGLHPLAHAALDCLFIVTWGLQGKGTDDRYKEDDND